MLSAVFVYARSDSQRLPGKAFMPLGQEGDALIEIVIKRALRVGADVCMLLTTNRRIDDKLAELGELNGIKVVRGETSDLVQRTLLAIEVSGATHFLRVNGDSPLFSPLLARQSMARLESGLLISNIFDRRFPYGVAVEWIDATTYKEYAARAQQNEREHVTAHLYRLSSELSTLSIFQPRDDSGLLLALDTKEDYDRLNNLLGMVDPALGEYWELYGMTSPEVIFKSVIEHR